MTSEVLRCLIALIAIAWVLPVFAATWLEGWVVAVADGDTLTILDKAKQQHKIRLSQIDAPESGMPYGRAAKKVLSDAVYRRTVTVQARETDRYGRVVGTVYLDQKNINMQMVASGYAWAYRHYVTDIAYCKAEDLARRLRRGLWADKKPLPPWQWRRLKQAGSHFKPANGRDFAAPCGVRAQSR
jgi:micrococcal nuclease